jgi:hypothetical protein
MNSFEKILKKAGRFGFGFFYNLGLNWILNLFLETI